MLSLTQRKNFIKDWEKFIINNSKNPITVSDLKWRDGTSYGQIAFELLKVYKAVCKTGAFDSSLLSEDLVFFYIFFGESNKYFNRLTGITNTELRKLEAKFLYDQFFKLYKDLSEEDILASYLYTLGVLWAKESVRAKVDIWRYNFVRENKDLPAEAKIAILLPNVPIEYLPLFEVDPQITNLEYLLSDLFSHELENLVLASIYGIVSLRHSLRDKFGRLSSRSFRKAFDLLGYMYPLLYLSNFIGLANYVRDIALTFLVNEKQKLTEDYKATKWYAILENAEVWHLKIKELIDTSLKDVGIGAKDVNLFSRIKTYGSLVEKFDRRKYEWIPDLLGYTIVLKRQGLIEQFGIQYLWKILVALLDKISPNYPIAFPDPKAFPVEIQYGNIKDVEKFISYIKETYPKIVVTQINKKKNLYILNYNGTRILLSPIRNTGYEGIHVNLYIDKEFGAEIKLMTARSYKAQLDGIATHVFYKFKMKWPEREELVKLYRRGEIPRTEFFKRANRLMKQLGLDLIQERRSILAIDKPDVFKFLTPIQLHAVLGKLEMFPETRDIYNAVSQSEIINKVKFIPEGQ